MRKLFAAFGAFLFAAAPAFAANIPLLTGPIEPNQIQATLNQLIQSINTGVGGLLNAQTGATATGAGTDEQVLKTYTLPGGTLSTAGQALRITCWGRTAANGNNKTRKLYFGANVITTATEAANDQPWQLQMIVMRNTATTQAVAAHGMAGLGGITMLDYVADGAETLASNIVIKCTGTDGTSSAGDITANGMITELIK